MTKYSMRGVLSLILVLFSAFGSWSFQPIASVSAPVDDAISEAALRRQAFDEYVSSIYAEARLKEAGLDLELFRKAIIGFQNLKAQGKLLDTTLITVIDFRKSSKQQRFFTVDLLSKKIVFKTLVAHGRNSGLEYPKDFSNRPNSNKSSLGFYVTGETYSGRAGYSLKLDGMDAGFNDNARQRGIVIHPADYVNEHVVANGGVLGRSLGCPALSNRVGANIIRKIRGGSCVFAYYNDDNYLSKTRLLNLRNAVESYTHVKAS